MEQKIIVVLNPDDSGREAKRKRLETKFAPQNVNINEHPKTLISDTELRDAKVIIDFDVSRYEHIELVEHLKSLAEHGISFEFLSDILGEEGASAKINVKLKASIDEFIQKLMPIKEKIPNKFLRPPSLKIQDIDFMFSHQDEEGIYFFSKRNIELEGFKLDISIEVDGQSTRICCDGVLSEVNPFDQDASRKYFYQLSLDEETKSKMEKYFSAVDDLNNTIENWPLVEGIEE